MRVLSVKPNKHHSTYQRRSYFQRFADLIIQGKLDIEKDQDSLERFLRWVNLWESNNKEAIRQYFEDLKSNYSASDLWEIVQFESDSVMLNVEI